MEELKTRHKAFTLAEVLITIVIIGVVAALTIPSVIASYKDKQYNTARLKALKTFGEAGKMASINNEINGQANAEDFVNNILSKYLKITKACDNATDCGFPSQIQPLNPEAEKKNSANLRKWNQLGNVSTEISSPTNDATMSRFISTADGFSALIHYNPKCARNSREITWGDCTYKECQSWAVDEACMNVIYDMNGAKGPNHVGEDIGFVTTFWSGLSTISVAPGIIPYATAKAIYDEEARNWADAQQLCADNGTSKVPYTLPNLYEIQSLAINYYLDSMPNNYLWTGTPVAERPGYAWHVYYKGSRGHLKVGNTRNVWCVRR